MKTFKSDVSNIEFPISERVSAKTIRHSILEVIQKVNPQFSHDSYLSRNELLNLILSCVAALQAPVIMMSQNRQEDKDRERSKKDYMINLKSELEIRTLHEKIDHFIMDQQQELLELQKTQIEMMNDILKQIEKKNLG